MLQLFAPDTRDLKPFDRKSKRPLPEDSALDALAYTSVPATLYVSLAESYKNHGAVPSVDDLINKNLGRKFV